MPAGTRLSTRRNTRSRRLGQRLQGLLFLQQLAPLLEPLELPLGPAPVLERPVAVQLAAVQLVALPKVMGPAGPRSSFVRVH